MTSSVIKYRKKVQEITKVCNDINDKTKYCAFYQYSGHVESFSVRIAESKNNFTNIVYEYPDLYFDKRLSSSKIFDHEVSIILSKLKEFLQK